MSLRKRYLILVLVTIALCAAIAMVNYAEYKQGKTLVKEELKFESNYAYAANSERSGTGTEAETININTASAQELADFLPGIGITKAENIVAYREAIGGFRSVEELIEVKGIGESTLRTIRSYCRVSDD